MTSADLTPDQLRRLREDVGRRLRYLAKLCERMDRLGFLPTDPLRIAAKQAYDAAHALHVACIYAGTSHCQHEPRQPITFNRPPRGSASGGGPGPPAPGQLPEWLQKQSGRESL